MELSVTFAGGNKGSIKLGKVTAGMKRNMLEGLRDAGQFMERNLKQALKDSNPTTFFYKSNKSTLASRTGNLRRSITHKLGQANVQIGPGGYAAKYGAVHEYGADIAVTDRMRRYLHSRGVHLRKNTTMIRIPKREWFGPCWEKNRKDTIRGIQRKVFKSV